MSIVVYSKTGGAITKASITELNTSAGIANAARIEITSNYAISADTVQRSDGPVWTFKEGGGLTVASGKTFTFSTQPVVESVGTVFAGTGSISGLRETNPRWFGAVSGVGKNNTIRLANTAAINKAWLAMITTPVVLPTTSFPYEHWYGAMTVDGIFETNGDIILGSGAATNGKTMVRGVGGEQSAIWGFGTGNVVDAVGRKGLSIKDLHIYSASAHTGLLLGRTGSGQGHEVYLDGVQVVGSYSKASLVTIAAEILRVNNSYFQNGYSGAAVYASSPRPDLIGVTSTIGTILTSTNSDIKFSNSTFLAVSTGMDTLRFDTYFDGSFVNCEITGQGLDTTNKLLRLIADPTDFNGKLTFTNSLLEGADATMVYHDYIGTADTTERSWNDVSFQGCTFTMYTGAGVPTLFAYKTIAHSTNSHLNMVDNKFASIYKTINTGMLDRCNLHLQSGVVTITGYANNCDITAETITFNGAAYGSRSDIRDVSTRYLAGVSPQAAATVTTPTTHTGDNALRGVVAAIKSLPTTPIPGEVMSADQGYGLIPGADGSAGQLVPIYWTGYNFMTLGAVPGTPASSAATGKKGTMLFDASYIYMCIATNTWRRIAWGAAW
jgi:hypothetical protein